MAKTSTPAKPRAAGRRQAGRAQRDAATNPYKAAAKAAGTLLCRQCGAVFRGGRWQWTKAPPGAKKALCEACRRVNDHYPAGILTLTGPVVASHGEEIEHLVRHQESAETADHPLNRVIAVERPKRGQMRITTTDIHLPRRIVNSVLRAFHGSMTERFEEDGTFVRIDWRRAV